VNRIRREISIVSFSASGFRSGGLVSEEMRVQGQGSQAVMALRGLGRCPEGNRGGDPSACRWNGLHVRLPLFVLLLRGWVGEVDRLRVTARRQVRDFPRL
jgi:hypothetical protein